LNERVFVTGDCADAFGYVTSGLVYPHVAQLY
jgi:hypothetical protein